MDDRDQINEREWARPDNWSRFGVYRSERDMRLWVPQKICLPERARLRCNF